MPGMPRRTVCGITDLVAGEKSSSSQGAGRCGKSRIFALCPTSLRDPSRSVNFPAVDDWNLTKQSFEYGFARGYAVADKRTEADAARPQRTFVGVSVGAILTGTFLPFYGCNQERDSLRSLSLCSSKHKMCSRSQDDSPERRAQAQKAHVRSSSDECDERRLPMGFVLHKSHDVCRNGTQQGQSC